MDLFTSLVQAVVSLVVVYLLALYLRRKSVLEEGHSMVLAHIVTDLCLPAMVFVNLASHQVHWAQLGPAWAMLSAELSCIVLAWILASVLRLEHGAKGAVVFCAAFGSSTFLGYAVIMEMFPQVPEAMPEAVLISEIGVGYPIFILGPMLAAYFGSGHQSVWKNLGVSLGFFKSPVFFALLIGLAWTPLGLPGADHVLLKPLFMVCNMLGQALTPLAILAVGLMFKVPKLREIWVALLLVLTIKLFLKPYGLSLGADAFGFEKLWKDVLIILGAMPPAVLGVVFLRRYGGDAAMASALLLAATITSCVSLLLVFSMVG